MATQEEQDAQAATPADQEDEGGGSGSGRDITDAQLERLYTAAVEQSYKYVGAGSKYSSYQMVLSKIDRFNRNMIMPNHEVSGLTFFTRPKLCLVTDNIRQDRHMSTLDVIDPVAWPFAARCLLDTNFAKSAAAAGAASYSPFFDNRSPFITPLTNCLVSINGYPDFVIDTETTEGGYFGEDQTFARGADMGAGTYDLTVNFRDVQGGFIWALMLYWARCVPLMNRGLMSPYPEDIAANRYCYTTSIYRFVLDPSRRIITKWSKATGCVPVSHPTGTAFNVNDYQSFIDSTQQYSINFKANTIEYMDPIIFQDFNLLMERFCPGLADGSYVKARNIPEHNFVGLPYIDIKAGYNELMFLCKPEELENPVDAVMRDIYQSLGLQVPR